MPHTETPLFGFAPLLERVFCPHPSLTALFPMSAINSANNSLNTHTPGSLTWSLTSLLRTLIHPHRSSHSLLPHRSTSCYPNSGCFLPSRICTLQPMLALHSPLHPDSAICSRHIPHTPTCKYPFIGRFHLYNTVHYIKKSLCCYVQVAPGIHTRICSLS